MLDLGTAFNLNLIMNVYVYAQSGIMIMIAAFKGGIACMRYRSVVADFNVNSLENRVVNAERNKPGLVAEEGSRSSVLDLEMPLI